MTDKVSRTERLGKPIPSQGESRSVMAGAPSNVLDRRMTRRPKSSLLTTAETTALRQEMGERLRRSRCEIDENMTRFAEEFGVKNNRWRMWELGEHAADEWVMVAMCDRYGLTMDWLYRGQIESLPPLLQAKLFRRYPDILEGFIRQGKGIKPPTSAAEATPAPVPNAPATGRRRKSNRRQADHEKQDN